MFETPVSESKPEGRVFLKDTLLHGQPVQIKCIEMNQQCYSLSEGILKTAQLEDEWYEDVEDPAYVINGLKRFGIKADLFTFWQRVPETEPRYPYHQEWDAVAVLPVTSYDDWWTRSIRKQVRRYIRRAEREGVRARVTVFDDEFVKGMTAIFNETPVRQGRHFYHYGKDEETVKRQFSRFNFREEMIGAYFEEELIGFIMLGISDNYADVGQMVSYNRHRDKRVNNFLIAKAVEVCEQKQLKYLVYGEWTDDSLSDFKGHCGFQKTFVPRYYIPFTLKGRVALLLRLHRGWKNLVPRRVINMAKKIRRKLSEKRAG